MEKEKQILMGNEAIVKSAVACGVQFVATYPGTPASEIGNEFSKIGRNNDQIYFEFSTNEKVAMEAVIGASFSGLRCLAAMKNFGMNVASDSMIPFIYTGCKGPTVIVVADDPSCHSSAQSEENSRAFSYLAHIPTLEPGNSQECYDFIQMAFELSEKFKIPVMLRLTTRVAHQRSIVECKVQSAKLKVEEGIFIKDKHSFVTMPPRVLEMKAELLEKIKKIQKEAEESEINKIANCKLQIANLKLGIVSSGVSHFHVLEAMEILGIEVPILKLGFFYPLPVEKIKDFIKPLDAVLVAEELEGYLEKEITAIAKDANPELKIYGKDTSPAEALARAGLPEIGEMKPEFLVSAIAKILNQKNPLPEIIEVKKIKHLPRFCITPACPYWKVFGAVKQALPEATVFGGDIGCYMIAALPPTSLFDYMISMGSSFGVGHGIAKATGKNNQVVAFMGDGTFLHSGMLGLLNAVYNKSNLLAIIVDNRITAMTGHQSNPGMGKTGEDEATGEVKIEEIVKAFGVLDVATVDATEDFEGMVATIKDFSVKDGVRVIVARHICALLEKRLKR